MDQDINGTTSTNVERSKQYKFSVRNEICELLYQELDEPNSETSDSDVTFLFPEKSDESGVMPTKRTKKPIKSIRAHKIILKKGSEVFRRMFNKEWKQKTEVEIVDATAEAFKEFLQCFYLGRGTFTKENIDQVIRLADKYMVDDCLTACSRFLMDTMTLDEVCTGYALANLFKLSDLRKFCEYKIQSNAATVLSSADFLECNQDTLAEILALNLNCAEVTVFNGCLNWAKNACKNSEGLDENCIEDLRKQLGKCLYLIRFGNMKLEELCQCTSQCNGLLSGDEFQDAVHCIGLKGHKSKKFIQNHRMHWNNNNIWLCRPGEGGSRTYFKGTESVQITSNKSTLLGGVYCRFLYYSGQYLTTAASIDIIEKSCTGEDVLFSGIMNFKGSTDAYLQLPAPIIIKGGIKYEILLGFNEKLGVHLAYTICNGNVKSSKGLEINFDANGMTHLISGLELMDLIGEKN